MPAFVERHAQAVFELLDLAAHRGLRQEQLPANDPRDIVLERGESFLGTGHRRALVFAFEPSTLALRPEVADARASRAPSIGFVRGGAVA